MFYLSLLATLIAACSNGIKDVDEDGIDCGNACIIACRKYTKLKLPNLAIFYSYIFYRMEKEKYLMSAHKFQNVPHLPIVAQFQSRSVVVMHVMVRNLATILV
jgi:hypothetical protein